jgi:hypothetical protein
MKQNSWRPTESVVVWYENLTLSMPLELNSSGGLCTTLPAVKRVQGFETGATGEVLLVVLGLALWPRAQSDVISTATATAAKQMRLR